ncbi:unnamed protein product [Rotaria magnacalcarata]|uniref:VWFA domain-containing protein n=1 Tax=Rotaria magnacalcarata TaxID=392030 RepID=A0A816ZYY3_9BILA|nr:unnamed protein product [Rotaria magnacalcarata]CAF3936565.1 unnamed protein product [Rotaria magnacalcarata]
MTEESSSIRRDVPVSSIQTELDLAFIIDATAMNDVALIVYRDQPPQEHTFAVQVNNFTDGEDTAKMNVTASVPRSGGDSPEAMAPVLHAAVHDLSWQQSAVKIALLITDAPPHGLSSTIHDNFPDGDPSGHDPIECAALHAECSITLHTIGCEPTAKPYRDQGGQIKN